MDLKTIAGNHRKDKELYQAGRKRQQELDDKMNEFKLKLDQLLEKVSAAKAKLEDEQRKYAETLEYAPVEVASRALSHAQSEAETAELSFAPLISTMKSESERLESDLMLQIPRIPYQDLAEFMFRKHSDIIGLWAYMVRKHRPGAFTINLDDPTSDDEYALVIEKLLK
jgi:hypothetical protein